MSGKLETIRSYTRGRFKVELAAHVEHDHPEGTIATGDDAADAEYVRKIETGEYPWYCLGVHVYVRSPGVLNENTRTVPVWREIGSSFLGWCDTYDLKALGARYVVSEAIEDARNLMEAVR